MPGYPRLCCRKTERRSTQFEVMTRKQIELVRSLSKAGNNGPWVTHWEEMAKKTLFVACSNICPYQLRSSVQYQWMKRNH